MSSTRAPGLYVGADIDATTHARSETSVGLAPASLTTHGVIVGMTGSGKTGLGMVILEEALSQGIPVLVLDPKGDMGNLLLTFPDLAPADFAPWVPAGTDATATATQWRDGLADWGIAGRDRHVALGPRDDRVHPGFHDGRAAQPDRVAGTTPGTRCRVDPR